MVLLMTGCNPEKENEWSRFYGFSKEDVVGHYEANPDESCYEEYPVENMTTHHNAKVDVIDQGGNIAAIRIVIPNVLNKYFSGVKVGDEGHDCEIIAFPGSNEELVIDVYKNDKNQVRLHGNIKQFVNTNHTKVDVFDVVKKTEERSKK